MTEKNLFLSHNDKEQRLLDLLSSVQKHLLVCSPYVTQYGMKKVSTHVEAQVNFGLITTLRIRDCLSGSHDPLAILDTLKKRKELGAVDKVWINQRLHAKCYIFDNYQAVTGSLNFTKGGWFNNIEIAKTLSKALTSELIEFVKDDILSTSKELSLPELESWIKDSEIGSLLKEKGNEKNEIDKLQSDLDEAYGLNETINLDKFLDLKSFMSWLAKNSKLLGAKTIISQYENHDGQNRQGHVSQCFYGSVLFFIHHTDLLVEFAKNLETSSGNDMPKMPYSQKNKWAVFLSKNRKIQSHQFDMGVTYNVLPESWGGCLYGGGGASGSIRRLLPLVARWISETD